MNNAGRTILLVEDEVLIAMAEERQLTGAGYKVLTAFSGEDAIKVALNDDNCIDIILMDIDLGNGIDGTQAAMEILKHREIPVLFQSSHTEKDIVEKTEKITSYGYVVKHSGITILDASIKMAFKLHKAYKELKEKEENLLIKERAIESSINAIAISDPDGDIIYVNPSFLKLWGFDSMDEVIGLKSSMIMKQSLKNEAVCDSFILSGGIQGEMIARRKDNTCFDVETSASEIYSQNNKPLGIIAAFQDITERKISEAKVRESNENYRILVENIDRLVCEIDYNGIYTYLSPAYKKVTGFSAEDLLGKNVIEQLHPDDLQCWIKRCCGNKNPDARLHDVWRFKIKNGEWRWLDCSTTFFEKTPGEVRAVVISTDITEQIYKEEKMKVIIRENEIYLNELHDRVVNNAAVIRTFVDFLMERFADDTSKQIFMQAVSRIWFCLSLYEKFHAGLEPSGIDLYTYIQDIIDAITSITDDVKENIILSEQLKDVTIDVKWVLPLGLILNELITNAVKYAYSRSTNGQICISHETTMDKITLCVSDNGKGFTYTGKSNIFGMGVSLVNKMVEMIGGDLKFDNESGTRCFITFNP